MDNTLELTVDIAQHPCSTDCKEQILHKETTNTNTRCSSFLSQETWDAHCNNYSIMSCRPSHNPPSLLLFATIVGRQISESARGLSHLPTCCCSLSVKHVPCFLVGPILTWWLLQDWFSPPRQNIQAINKALRKITFNFPVSKLTLWELVGAVWKIR